LLYSAELRAQCISESGTLDENIANNANAKSHLPQIRALLCQSFHKRQTGLEATLHRSAAQATLAELHRTRMTNGNGEVSAK
jgi:hypothetical protein